MSTFETGVFSETEKKNCFSVQQIANIKLRQLECSLK